MALLDTNGNVLVQYAYEPYGELIAEDRPGWLIPKNGVGHQGLFFERFDAPLDWRQLALGGFGVYHNRNRSYSPYLGRYLQRDPNEAGLPILTALTMNGQTMDALLGTFNPQGHYGDGMNLYLYLGSNPINRLDALGLDWFDDVDDFFADYYGERSAAAGAVMEKVGMAFSIAQMVAQIAIQFVPGGTVVMMGMYMAQGDWGGALQMAAFGSGLRAARLAGRMMGRYGAMRGAYRTGRAAGKAVNLPSWRSVKINMPHILSGHTAGGRHVSPKKDLWPPTWSPEMIAHTIRQAYRNASKCGKTKYWNDGTRVYLTGYAGGRTVEMYLNLATEVIESAWPK